MSLEAQQAAVKSYVEREGAELLREFTETESGRKSERPELRAALALCRRRKARLVIAKLDRLSRNLAFTASVMDSGVRFVALDMPRADRLTLHVMAAVAEHERRMISERTKAALAAARARGVELGATGKALARRNRAEAVRAAEELREEVEDLMAEGLRSFNGLARELNARGVPTRRGGRWHAQSVKRLLARLESPA